MLAVLKSDAQLCADEGAKVGLKEMELLASYLKSMAVADKFSFDLSLARGLDYYTGVIYEAVFTGGESVGSIGGGGRYDDLVGMFCGNGKKIPAVGTSIGVERVFTIIERQIEQVRCAVLLCGSSVRFFCEAHAC